MSLLMVGMSVEARSLGDVALKLKRQDGVVQVAVLSLGANARVVTQTSTRSTWRGRLIGDVGAALKEGPQQVSMPEAGLASIRLDASTNGFELRIEATSGRSLPKPSINSNGKDLVFSRSAKRLVSIYVARDASSNLPTSRHFGRGRWLRQ